MKISNGIKLAATRVKLFDLAELLTALEEAAVKVRAEIVVEHGAEAEAA